MQEFLRWLPQDSTSAFFRALHPDDHQWFDPAYVMQAEIASILTEIRFVDALGKLEEVPAEWAPARYGPPQPDVPADDGAALAAVEDEARAKAVAAELRG